MQSKLLPRPSISELSRQLVDLQYAGLQRLIGSSAARLKHQKKLGRVRVQSLEAQLPRPLRGKVSPVESCTELPKQLKHRVKRSR